MDDYTRQVTADPDFRLGQVLWGLGGAVILGGIGALVDPLLGILVGALVGAGAGALTKRLLASSDGREQWMQVWIQGAGWQYLPDFASELPPDAPGYDQMRRGGLSLGSSLGLGGYWTEIGQGIRGQLPGTGEFGFYAYDVCSERIDNHADGPSTTHTERVPHVGLWLQAPGPPLQALALSSSMFAEADGVVASALRKLSRQASGALSNLRAVELESVQFEQMYKLMVGDGDTDLDVRRVFDPQLIQQLVENPALLPAPVRFRDGYWFMSGQQEFASTEAIADQLASWLGGAVAVSELLAPAPTVAPPAVSDTAVPDAPPPAPPV